MYTASGGDRADPTKQLRTDAERGADNLFERVLDAVAPRAGYYVVAGARRGPLSLDEAYAVWESEMQGEVLYFDGSSYFHTDGTRA